MPLVIGQLVGRYRVDALIGRGGMGEVYRGWDAELNRVVALKVMRDDLDEVDDESKIEASSRFAREARMAARMVSPHFCAIYEVLEHEEMPVLVMEWIEGATLRTKIQDNRVALAQRVAWVITLARGLGEAHANGIVHRDFKPGNVLITNANSAIKIVDFGLAKRVRSRAVVDVQKMTETSGFETKTGMILGTERYMAPEQAAGVGFDERTDQFAWAIVAYELLSRMHPQNATSDGRFPVSLPRPLTESAPGVSERISLTIARALSLSPAHRFPSMKDVVAELEGPSTAARPRAMPAAMLPIAQTASRPPTAKRVPILLVSFGLLLIAAATATVFVVRGARSKARPPLAAVPSASSSGTVVAMNDEADADAPSPAPTLSASPTTPPPPTPSSVASSSETTRERAARKLAQSRLPGARPLSIGLSNHDAGPYWVVDILPLLNAKKADVSACYARPDFDGSDNQISVWLTVDDEGRVETIQVSPSADDHLPTAAHLYACIADVYRPIKLPPPQRKGRVRFNINVDR